VETEIVLLAAAWCTWCAIHSLLAAPGVRQRLEGWSPFLSRWYRLAYNIFAAASLAPLVIWLEAAVQGPPLVQWQWPWTVLQGAAWLAALLLFLGGAKVYPLAEFLGLADPGSADDENRPPPLVTTGVLGVVRHPWYLAGLLILWARTLSFPEVVVAAILSVYLVIGAFLEEKRLLSLYGATYRRYRRQVPMFVPTGGLLRLLRRDRG
jgi:protein-S-isoprenylcysteine O-methyltransferase Ste14